MLDRFPLDPNQVQHPQEIMIKDETGIELGNIEPVDLTNSEITTVQTIVENDTDRGLEYQDGSKGLMERHQRILELTTELRKCFKGTISETEEKVQAWGNKIGNVRERNGILVIDNPGFSLENLDGALAQYTRSVETTGQYGALSNSSSDEFHKSFSFKDGAADKYGFTDHNLSDSIRLYKEVSQKEEKFDFSYAAEEFDLDDQEKAKLAKITEKAEYVTRNPSEGSNFLYRYSQPFIEIGTADDGNLRARLGVTLSRTNDGMGRNTSSFEGVDIPTDRALEIIEARLTPYIEEAHLEKDKVVTKPSAEVLKQEYTEKARAKERQFIEQFKYFAPEFAGMGDEKLRELLNIVADSLYLERADLSPVDFLAAKTMKSEEAITEVECTKDGRVLPNYVKTSIWEPQSYLFANGRSGTITRVDYSASPFSYAAGGKEISTESLNLDRESYKRIRLEILEANLATQPV